MTSLATADSTAPAATRLTFDHDDTTCDQYGQLDILCGKEITGKTHFGNIHFRAIVALHGTAYRRAGKRTLKSSLVKSILHEIRSVPGIRFLRKGRDQTWIEITDERKIRDKIGHGLRDMKKHNDPLVDARDCLTLLSNCILVGSGYPALEQQGVFVSTKPQKPNTSSDKVIISTKCSNRTSMLVSESISAQSNDCQHLNMGTNMSIVRLPTTPTFHDIKCVTAASDTPPIEVQICNSPSGECMYNVNGSPTVNHKKVCCCKRAIMKYTISPLAALTKTLDLTEQHVKSTTCMLQRSLGSVLENCGETLDSMASAGCSFHVKIPLDDFEIETGLDLQCQQEGQTSILETDLNYMNHFMSVINCVPPSINSNRGDNDILLMNKDILKQLNQVVNF